MGLQGEKSQHRAERYFLGEMAPREQEEFEREMFESPELGEEVRELFALAENAKVVFEEDQALGPAEEPASFVESIAAWFRPSVAWPTAACLASAALIYVSLVSMPGLRNELDALRSPQIVAATVLRPLTRGADNTVTIHESQKLVRLSFDVNATGLYESAHCVVRAAGGEEVFRLAVARQELLDSLEVSFPAGLLSSGRYELELRGVMADGDEELMERYEFTFREQPGS